MHLQISTRFSLKDYPTDYHGPVGANIRFGHERPLSLLEMSKALLREIFTWYVDLQSAEQCRVDVLALSEWLYSCYFDEEGKDEESA